MKNINIIKFIGLYSLTALMLTACQSSESDLTMPALATVDGQPISNSLLQTYLQQQGITEPTAEQNGEALDNLIQLFAVSAAATDDAKFIQQADLQAQLELARRRLLFEAYAKEYVARFPISDQQLLQQYQDTVAASGAHEYQFDTLTFADQAAAVAALVQLQRGESDFQQLAASTGSEQLGWMNLAAAPEDFRNAVLKTAVDEVVPLPLASGNGWRVVRIADRRKFDPPSFAQVSDGMRADINRKKVQAWIQGLRERADVQLENVTVDAAQ